MMGFEQDAALNYANWTAIGFAVCGVISSAIVYFFAKKLLACSRILVGVAMLVFPVGTLFVGNIVALENAKKNVFCLSCHEAMADYVLDMTDPNNFTIASKHYNKRWINQDQCYSCHTGYGIQGSIHAKTKGIYDVIKYYTGAWESQIKMKKPFPNKDCLKCHEHARRYAESKVHEKIADKLANDRLFCWQCHGPIHGKKKIEEEEAEKKC